MNYKVILHTLGSVLNIEAACMALPAICALCYKDTESFIIYLLSALLCLIVGVALSLIKPKRTTMYSKEGFVTVALAWIIISLFGAVPFFVSGYIPNFIDAFFETVSGFTTTGASILTDVEALPRAHLFWRSFTHWIGGMGVLVFLVALLPLSGGSNVHLLRAESTGPSVSKLVPKIRSSAKILYLIYMGLTLIEIILLYLDGIGAFSAITLAFGTAGTGGFGVLNTSIADYSPYVQITITVFMTLFGIDFTIYYLILTRRMRDALRSDEYKVYLGIILVSALIISINCRQLFPDFGTSLRHGFFQTASIITTTGYSTVNFDLWPALSKTILVALMFIGACAGSTGGGIKVSRILILLKSIRKEIKIAAHPNSTHKISMNGKTIESETVRTVSVYIAVFLVLFAVSMLIISLDNYDFTTNFTAVAATINNIGPGLGLVGPAENFSMFSALSKIVLSLDMLIGRLEIFPILMLVSPYTWKR
ncbi:MAG: TrkH family potassium uptake protein [Clostridia bacterium]|nr:TrkH family potassium uptake protein [Clostridia bacterium]